MYIIKISIESFHFAVTVRSVYLSLQRPGNENNQCTRILMITWALQRAPRLPTRTTFHVSVSAIDV